MLEVAYLPKLYEIRLIQSHVDHHIKNQARKLLKTIKDPVELCKDPLPLAQQYNLAPDQTVLDWQFYNPLPLKIIFTIL